MDPHHFDPEKFVKRVGSGKTITEYKSGDVIFQQGAPAEHVYYLQSGRAKEVARSEHGKVAVVGMIEAKQFFGTSAIDGTPTRLSTVVAVTACVVTEITKEAMKDALKEPHFARLFMAYLLHHNSQIEAEKIDLLFNSSEKRLAQRLLVLAHIGEDSPRIIGSEITQEMLADMIGTTRPRVNSFLVKFRRLGFIRYITDPQRKGHNGIEVLPALLRAVLTEAPGTGIKKTKED